MATTDFKDKDFNDLTLEEIKALGINNEEQFKALTGKQQADLLASFLKTMAGKSETERSQLLEDLDFQGILDGFANSPRKNFRRNQKIAEGIEGGFDALKTISNITTARRQVDEAKRLENELVDPQAPPTTPKSQELLDATEMARRDVTQPMREIDPMLQRNMDLLRGGMNIADVNSGGQAGLNASMKQNVINQARSANQQLIPQIEAIRRQKQEEYNRLISAGISEDDMRFKQQMQKYQVAENRYLMEAEAIGGLRAAGEENLFNQQNQMFDQAGSAASGAIKNMNYGGVSANEVNTANQFQLPNTSELYNKQQANNYQTGLMTDNINQSGNTYKTPQFTALGALGTGYQDYSTRINSNLDNWISNPLRNGINRIEQR